MLYLTATPIGNLEDITLRALRILKEVDFILAEDTRKTGILLARFAIKNRLVSFHDYSQGKKISKVVGELKNGKKAALVSNAGTPLVSDPGFKLVKECLKQKIEITCLPGASSPVTALVLSGLAPDKFAFFGYPPRKQKARQNFLAQAANSFLTSIFLESPYRIIGMLKDLKAAVGNREVAICREMTKKFEEIIRSDLDQAISILASKKARGEYTVVVSGRQKT